MTDSLDDVRLLAEALMDALGAAHLGVPLQARGWTFGFDRARVRLGRCAFGRGRKTITLSAAHARQGWTAEVEDTVRHEIAHALDFETRGRSGHDATWKRWADRCGATPRACSRAPREDDGSSAYMGVCEACGHRHPFFRLPLRAYRCPACRAGALRVETRAGGTPVQAQAPFSGRCPACGTVQPFGRRPRRVYACVPCCTKQAGGRFDARFALRIEPTR